MGEGLLPAGLKDGREGREELAVVSGVEKGLALVHCRSSFSTGGCVEGVLLLSAGQNGGTDTVTEPSLMRI